MKIPSDRTAQILLAVAVLVLLSAVFSGALPLLKLALIALVVFLAWNTTQPKGHSAFFSNDAWRVSADEEQGGRRSCRYAFSNAVIDLTDSSALPEQMDVHAAFSNVSIRLPVDANITIHASCAFGQVSLPHQSGVVFGTRTAVCGSKDPNAPHLRVDVSCAFGAVDFHMG